jgi:hypothetical protein
MQNDPLEKYPWGQLPPGPGGFGCGNGSAIAALETSASAMMVASFMGVT